jgi:hypothetical protein
MEWLLVKINNEIDVIWNWEVYNINSKWKSCKIIKKWKN